MDFDFDCHGVAEELRGADIWSHIDSIVTRPIGTRLQRVDIEIESTFFREKPDNNDVILEAVLGDLPLLHKKGILFVKADIR